MEVITTISGLKNYGSSYQYTIGYAGFQRKESIDDFHAGHIQCINSLKNSADKVMLGFFDERELFSLLFPDVNLSAKTCNKDVCISWAESNGVDILFWPDPGEVTSMFSGYNIDDLKNWAKDYCLSHGYVFEDGSNFYLLQCMMIIDKLRIELDLDRRDYRVGSWKDGILRLYHKHYVETNGYYSYILIPTLINPDDSVPYSSSISQSFVEAKSQFLSQIPTIINNYKSLIISDIDTFKNNVQTAIDSLDATGEFHTISINVYYNMPFVESGYAFIEVALHISSDFYTGLPPTEGRYVYPFYEQIQ